jgi:hypothetical protein
MEQMIMLPVGILRSYGKTAEAVAAQSLKALKRYVHLLLLPEYSLDN